MMKSQSLSDQMKKSSANPRILHRIYFEDMAPFRDNFEHYLETWHREMPGYKVMKWNASNLDLNANDWVCRAVEQKSAVFLSEYFRWKVLQQYGGMYLDADCEILNGAKLHALIEETFCSNEYDAALGVEDYDNGHPTAQSMIAKPNAELVKFMVNMYDTYLSGPLWHWREIRGLIGPQLISLYFMEKGIRENHGMMCRLTEPKVVARVKVYPQDYFSPKFTIDGKTLRHTKNTCVYHLFANLNMAWDDETKQRLRDKPMLYSEYVDFLQQKTVEGAKRSPESIAAVIANEELDRNVRIEKARQVKTLHRIYFGFDGKPDAFLGYLDTWKQQLPDYEIKYWDASSLPVDGNDYVRELYQAKDHAFLSDYFRWWVLREHGGVYLDADIEVLNGDIFNMVIDNLLADDSVDAVIGIDEKKGGWYTAHSMAAKKGSPIAKFMCSVYENLGPIRAWRKKAFYLWAPQLTALYFFDQGWNPDGMGTSPNLDHPVVAARVKIYPQEYFAPISPSNVHGELFHINALTEKSCLCHHFACSWHDIHSMYSGHKESFSRTGNVLLKDLVRRVRREQRVRTAAVLNDKPNGLFSRMADLFSFGKSTVPREA